MTSDQENFENDEALDERLHRHLSDRLNDQLGRSATFFAKQLLREQRAAGQAKAGTWSALRPWAWMTAAASIAAAAAVVAIAVTGQNFGRSRGPISRDTVKPIIDDKPQPVERTLFDRTVDDGTVFLEDDMPARQLRRQRVEQVTWLDKKTGRTSMTESVPQEDIMLVAYDKH